MTFVIKDKIENNDPLQKGNIFDPDPYNYLFNKSTCFLEGQFTRNDHMQLHEILTNLEQYDPELIDLLFYVHEVEQRDKVIVNSALNIAHESSNNRGIDIILSFMAKSNNSNSHNFKHLFPSLTSRESFWNYIKELTYQTVNMENKQNLKVDSTFSPLIVSMGASNCNYMDQQQFKTILNEQIDDKDCNYYPVKVKCLRIDWILNHTDDEEIEYGKEFLGSILTNESLDHYSIETCQMIIEFLFNKFQKYIYTRQFYTFLLEIVLQSLVIFFNERAHQYNRILWGEIEDEHGGHTTEEYKRLRNIHVILISVLSAFLFLTNCSNIMNQIDRVRYDWKAYSGRIQSYLDLMTIILIQVLIFWLYGHIYIGEEDRDSHKD